MKIEFWKANPVKEAWGLTNVDKQCYPKDWWTQGEWRQYDQIYWIVRDEIPIGCLAMGRDMAFSRSENDKAWVKSGSLYLATTSILPQWRTRSISDTVRRWQLRFAKDHGYDMISTNCRKGDAWYLIFAAGSVSSRLAMFRISRNLKENTIVFQLKLS